MDRHGCRVTCNYVVNPDNVQDIKIIQEIIAEIETKKLVIISEFLTPIIFPKNPDKTAPNNGMKTIKYPNCIFNLSIYQFLRL